MPTPDCDSADKILSHYLHRLYRNDHSRSGRSEAQDFPTSLQQQFLRLVPAKTLLSELSYAGVGWRDAGVRTRGAMADNIRLPVLIKDREWVTDANGQVSMRIELHWFIQPPAEAPALVVEVNRQRQTIEYAWEENLSAVKLYGLEALEVQKADLRWRWDDSTKTLSVAFRTKDPR